MKNISRLYQYDDQYFAGKIPADAMRVSSSLEENYPIYMEEDFISADECREIFDQFSAEGVAGTPGAGSVRGDGVRKAYNFLLQGRADEIYSAAFDRNRPRIEQFFSTRIVGSDGAHGLGYGTGCKYDVHADNCDAVVDESGQLQEFRLVTANRQLSSILFLTRSVDEISGANQHIGGNLSFRFLLDKKGEMLIVEPRPGLFVTFPSNPVFSHEVHVVHEVSSDFRMAIVNWYACE